MVRSPMSLLFACVVALTLLVQAAEAQWLTTPQPGDIWKEYVRYLSSSRDTFRVTDPNATNTTARDLPPEQEDPLLH